MNEWLGDTLDAGVAMPDVIFSGEMMDGEAITIKNELAFCILG